MKIEIKKMATVRMGYSFRSRLEASGNGDVSVIQMKDLSGNNIVDCSELVKTYIERVKEHHLARKKDLIFRSRGHVTTAAILIEDLTKTVVAAPLLRIRITQPDMILPEYLNWYISQRDAQHFLTSRAKGTVQKMISKRALEDLEVPVPSLERQKKIVQLALLSAREQSLLQQLSEKREQYIGAVLMRFAKGE